MVAVPTSVLDIDLPIGWRNATKLFGETAVPTDTSSMHVQHEKHHQSMQFIRIDFRGCQRWRQ